MQTVEQVGYGVPCIFKLSTGYPMQSVLYDYRDCSEGDNFFDFSNLCRIYVHILWLISPSDWF